MRTCCFVTVAMLVAAAAMGADAPAAKPLKVLVVTGGHGFEEAPFIAMWKSFKNIEFTHLPQKEGGAAFASVADWPYDVVVLYNFNQQISEKEAANFTALMDKGVGLVINHHAVAAYPDWPEYRKILGGRYYLKDEEENGVKHARCTWEHDLDINVTPVPGHPITEGIGNFTVNDEVYKGYTVEPDNKILLTTDHPKSQKEIGWVRSYRNSRVAFIQLGHGQKAYENENFRKLLLQAVLWTAKKD